MTIKSKTCGIVVLYFPDSSNMKCIQSYIGQLDSLVIIDNSPTDNSFLLNELISDKVLYVPNKNNLGIAKALNLGVEYAIKKGYEYVLTMDQDSIAPPDMLETLAAFIEGRADVGIAAPYYLSKEFPLYPKDESACETISVITSGNLISVAAFKDIGGFNESLFIDYVDFDFCFRMIEHCYKIIKVNSVLLLHSIGNISKTKVLFWSFYTTNHSPIRLYYRTRNRLYLRRKYKKQYPEFFRKDFNEFIKELIKVLLVEENKMQKLKMIIMGLLDYKFNKFGKISLS